jgi:hypothetical protein
MASPKFIIAETHAGASRIGAPQNGSPAFPVFFPTDSCLLFEDAEIG